MFAVIRPIQAVKWHEFVIRSVVKYWRKLLAVNLDHCKVHHKRTFKVCQKIVQVLRRDHIRNVPEGIDRIRLFRWDIFSRHTSVENQG